MQSCLEYFETSSVFIRYPFSPLHYLFFCDTFPQTAVAQGRSLKRSAGNLAQVTFCIFIKTSGQEYYMVIWIQSSCKWITGAVFKLFLLLSTKRCDTGREGKKRKRNKKNASSTTHFKMSFCKCAMRKENDLTCLWGLRSYTQCIWETLNINKSCRANSEGETSSPAIAWKCACKCT